MDPVLAHQKVAAFQVATTGRFWVAAGAWGKLLENIFAMKNKNQRKATAFFINVFKKNEA
jgi:hypothetical protein